MLLGSLIVVGLPIPDIIGSIDDKVSSINVVSLDRCFEEFWVMDSTMFQEVKMFILP